MSAGFLFFIIMVIGIFSLVFGVKGKGKGKVFLIIVGIVLAALGGFGVFTAIV